MEENRKLGRWRTIALKLAVLWFFWLLLATIFAAQFYWIGRDLPLKVSWHEYVRPVESTVDRSPVGLRFLFLAEFLEGGIATQRVPLRMEP
jgi:hypothetical protein